MSHASRTLLATTLAACAVFLVLIAWMLRGGAPAAAQPPGPPATPAVEGDGSATAAAAAPAAAREPPHGRAFRALADEHLAESARVRGLDPEERTRRLRPFIERYSALYQEARDEPAVQFDCLRALAGLYASSGDMAAAAGVNQRLLALEPAMPAASGRSREDVHRMLELYRCNGLELLAEVALQHPDDAGAQQRLADLLAQQPDLFAADDLALLEAAALKALLAARAGGRQQTALAVAEAMLRAVLARPPAANDPGAADRWMEAAVTAAAAAGLRDRTAALATLAAEHRDRLGRGASYYAVLPFAGGGWEATARSAEFLAAAKRALAAGAADAFTPELTLRTAQAELAQQDYPAAAARLTRLDREGAFAGPGPEQRELRLCLVFALGEAFLRMEQRQQADAYWDRFIQLADPGDPRIQLIKSVRGTR